MPVYQKEMPELMAQAKSLQDLILGAKAKEAQIAQQGDLDAQAKEAAIGQKIRTEEGLLPVEQKKVQQNIDLVNQTRKGLPAGSSMSAGGVSINTPDPFSNIIKQQQIADRDEGQMRLETQALQNEFKKLSGYDPEKLKNLQEAEDLLKQNSKMSYGQLQTVLARLKDKGALSEGDVGRVLPRTARRDIKGIAGYLGLGNGLDEDMLSPEEVAQAQQILQSNRSAMENMRTSGASELEQRAKVLAPNVSRTGQLPTVMKSLGMSANPQQSQQQQQAPAAVAPMSFEEFKAARRAGKI
jgi:hypothetical protein